MKQPSLRELTEKVSSGEWTLNTLVYLRDNVNWKPNSKIYTKVIELIAKDCQ